MTGGLRLAPEFSAAKGMEPQEANFPYRLHCSWNAVASVLIREIVLLGEEDCERSC